MVGRKRANSSGARKPSKRARVQLDSPQPASQDDKPLISLDLIKGSIPSFKPNATKTGFDYVSITKGPGDRDKNFDLIRIIIVHPGQPGDPLVCSIKVRVLPLLDAVGDHKKPTTPGLNDGDIVLEDYVALSYAWEGQERTAEIKIKHSEGTLPFRITPSLKAALTALRDPAKPQTFWADAISMDQNNSTEKSQQLPLMSRIYREASKVCVWLGHEETGILQEKSERPINITVGDAFTLMHTIRNWQIFRQVVENNTTCQQWSAFMWLLNRPWFERRWVVQEIVLAREAELRCGSQRIGWKEFAEAVSFFELMEDRVKTLFRGDPGSDHAHDKFGKFREFSACRLVRVTGSVVSRRQEGRILRRSESLESLISILAPFRVGDPKDIVYAILSLANDVKVTADDVKPFKKLERADLRNSLRNRVDVDSLLFVLNRILPNWKNDQFQVDYKRDFDEICLDLYAFAFRHSRSLDLILRPWCPKNALGEVDGCSRKLPSWVRPLTEYAWKLSIVGDVERTNADLLVGLPGKSSYQAAGEIRAQYNFERAVGPRDGHILSVEGFHLDILSTVEERAAAGTLPFTWLRHKKYEGGHAGPATYSSFQETRSGVSELFWRTMVAGKGQDGESPPLAYSLLSQDVFDKNEDLNLPSDAKATQNPVFQHFLNRVLSVIWGRRLAITSKHGYLALIPGSAASNDVISILYGCSVPVVLRDSGTLTNEGNTIWELVGECYIHDMMMGEALVVRRLEGSKDSFYTPQYLKIR